MIGKDLTAGGRFIPMLGSVVFGVLLLTGCDRSSSTDAAKVHDSQTSAIDPAQRGARVASVDGNPIFELDLRVHLRKLLGEDGLERLTDDVRRKALDSLVMTRVIAGTAQKELTDEAQARLDAQVNLYRDQLLVNEYLREHSAPEPVSSSMVAEYYRNNPELFGGGHERSFELIIATSAPAAPQRDALLRAFRDVRQSTDWPSQVQRLQKQGFELEYRQASNDDPVLPVPLRSVVSSLEVEQTSEPGMVQRRPYLVRVLGDQERVPRPLAEVSADIRSRLAPNQVKKAVRTIADPLMKVAKVEYFD